MNWKEGDGELPSGEEEADSYEKPPFEYPDRKKKIEPDTSRKEKFESVILAEKDGCDLPIEEFTAILEECAQQVNDNVVMTATGPNGAIFEIPEGRVPEDYAHELRDVAAERIEDFGESGFNVRKISWQVRGYAEGRIAIEPVLEEEKEFPEPVPPA